MCVQQGPGLVAESQDTFLFGSNEIIQLCIGYYKVFASPLLSQKFQQNFEMKIISSVGSMFHFQGTQQYRTLVALAVSHIS